MWGGVQMSQSKEQASGKTRHQCSFMCLSSMDISLTFLTIVALITGVADAGTHYADAVSSAVDVDALVGRHVALSAFPPAVALAAATRVLAVTTAQHRAGSWTRHMQQCIVRSDTRTKHVPLNRPTTSIKTEA